MAAEGEDLIDVRVSRWTLKWPVIRHRKELSSRLIQRWHIDLDGKPEKHFKRELLTHNIFLFVMWLTSVAAGYLCIIGFLILAGSARQMFPNGGKEFNLSPLWEMSLLLAYIAAAIILLWLTFRSIGMRTQWASFLIGRALYLLKKGRHTEKVPVLTGRAAKAVFNIVYGRRITWIAAPAASDRALHVALPLLDVEFPSGKLTDKQRDRHCRLLKEALVAIVVGRTDLLQAIRNRHPNVQPREIGERDERHLDPLRGHSWIEVVKEFVLPLVSLIMSAVAILVSVFK